MCPKCGHFMFSVDGIEYFCGSFSARGSSTWLPDTCNSVKYDGTHYIIDGISYTPEQAKRYSKMKAFL